MADLADTKAAIELTLRRHEHAGALFSGGKKSVVLAKLLEPHRDRVELIWINTGAILPHMVEFVRGYSERFKVTEVLSDQPRRLQSIGFPVRVVPVANTPVGVAVRGGGVDGPRQLLTDWIGCCSDLRARPALDYATSHGIGLLFHGQRNDGKIDTMLRGAPEVCAPLWNWTSEELSRFVKDEGLALPAQYAEGYADSVECWNCTAEVDATRFRWLAEKHPERLASLRPMLEKAYGAIGDELFRSRVAMILGGFTPTSDPEKFRERLTQLH